MERPSRMHARALLGSGYFCSTAPTSCRTPSQAWRALRYKRRPRSGRDLAAGGVCAPAPAPAWGGAAPPLRRLQPTIFVRGSLRRRPPSLGRASPPAHLARRRRVAHAQGGAGGRGGGMGRATLALWALAAAAVWRPDPAAASGSGGERGSGLLAPAGREGVAGHGERDAAWRPAGRVGGLGGGLRVL